MSDLRYRLLLFACIWVIANGCGGVEPADLIVTGGTIHTLSSERPQVEAVVVKGDRVVFAGNMAQAALYRGPRTLVLDIEGRTMLPGLVDAHGHLLGLGRYLSELSLTGTASPDTIRDMVVAWQSGLAPGEWVHGRGWDQNDWENDAFPTWRDLAGTEAHPVFLKRVGGHAAWLNKKALDVLGITGETPDPPGGIIVRDSVGEPTGVLIDRAKDTAWERVPEPTIEKKREMLRRAIDACKRYGLTGVHEAQTSKDVLRILRDMSQAGELGLRVYSLLDSDDSTFVLDAMEAGPVEDGYLKVRAVKVYVDGALGSRGASLLEPYADEPSSRGLFVSTRTALENWAKACLEKGFQMCVHAIGDAGNRAVLDVYENALVSSRDVDHRFRIEHAQVMTREDIKRMVDLGVIASMQPTHATSDMYWAEKRLGASRMQGAYAWRKIIDAGGIIACGSDFPVESANPLWGIYAAVTRQDAEGWPDGGWTPGERMTMMEAVKGFTTNAAIASFSENETGTIEMEKLADFTVIDRDPFATTPKSLLEARVIYTIVGGEIVYVSPDTLGATAGDR